MTKEALKLALEALEEMQNAIYNIGGEHAIDLNFAIEQADVSEFAITAIKAALEAKDEPWEKFCDSNCVWTDHHPDCKLAQRTWAGLTDEDIGMCLDAGNGSMSKIISFIEAKLKEKNT